MTQNIHDTKVTKNHWHNKYRWHKIYDPNTAYNRSSAIADSRITNPHQNRTHIHSSSTTADSQQNNKHTQYIHSIHSSSTTVKSQHNHHKQHLTIKNHDTHTTYMATTNKFTARPLRRLATQPWQTCTSIQQHTVLVRSTDLPQQLVPHPSLHHLWPKHNDICPYCYLVGIEKRTTYENKGWWVTELRSHRPRKENLTCTPPLKSHWRRGHEHMKQIATCGWNMKHFTCWWKTETMS
jgi:hypothetical protein